jgi:hypothetical protein
LLVKKLLLMQLNSYPKAALRGFWDHFGTGQGGGESSEAIYLPGDKIRRLGSCVIQTMEQWYQRMVGRRAEIS